MKKAGFAIASTIAVAILTAVALGLFDGKRDDQVSLSFISEVQDQARLPTDKRTSIALQDFTSFDWDLVHMIPNSESAVEVADRLGFIWLKWWVAPTPQHEDVRFQTWVFVHNDKVVAYSPRIYGLPQLRSVSLRPLTTVVVRDFDRLAIGPDDAVFSVVEARNAEWEWQELLPMSDSAPIGSWTAYYRQCLRSSAANCHTWSWERLPPDRQQMYRDRSG